MAETDAPSLDTEDNILYEVVVDGVFGAVAGFAGTVVLTAFLLASSLLGGFQFENFAATTEILLLDPFLGRLSAVVGYVIFVIGGSVVWPLFLASMGTYLPGKRFATKGAIFGVIVWPGFLLGFGDVLSTTTVGYAAFAAFSLVGHAAYGWVMGDVFDRLYTAERPVIAKGLSPFDLAERTVADAGGTATEGRSARTRAAAEARAAAAEEPAEETLRDVDVADLPPLLRFDQAIDRIESALPEDEEYPQFEAFKREYEQLKRSPSNRQTLVSDLRADLNGLAERLPDEDGSVERWLDSMGNRMFTYLKSGRSPSLTLDLVDVTLRDDDGDPAELESLRESLATCSVTVLNQGDRSGAVIRVSFYNDEDVLLRSDDLSMGYMDPGERKQLSTKVYVPSIADHYEATVLDPSEGQRFIEGL